MWRLLVSLFDVKFQLFANWTVEGSIFITNHCRWDIPLWSKSSETEKQAEICFCWYQERILNDICSKVCDNISNDSSLFLNVVESKWCFSLEFQEYERIKFKNHIGVRTCTEAHYRGRHVWSSNGLSYRAWGRQQKETMTFLLGSAWQSLPITVG